MQVLRVVAARAALMFLILLLLPIPSALANEVSYLLEMGGPVRQEYNCIFTGTVTSKGKSLPGAHVTVEFAWNGQGRTEMVDADENGRYILRLAVEGTEQTQSTWRLTAKAAVIGATPAELEGRLILLSEPTVVIHRVIAIDGIEA